MSISSHWLNRLRGLFRFAVRGGLLLSLLLPSLIWAVSPLWWAQRGVLTAGASADDFAAVNQGQLKNIAKQGYAEMTASLPGGAGAILDAAWAFPAASTDDFRAINLGQLKAIADPFYARLQTLGYTGQPLVAGQTRPWSGSSDDYALANLGQLKQVFSFLGTNYDAYDGLSYFVPGSLAKHCNDWFLAAFLGKIPSGATQDFLTGSGARSTTIWANAVDLSCIISGAAGGWQQGALIAPRFAVVASHVGVDSSYTCRDNAGNAVTRSVTGSTSLGSDRTLVCFASDFTGIIPAKILPPSFANKYKPSQTLRLGVPLMKWKRMGAAWKVGVGVGNGWTGLSHTRPAELTPWYMEWVGGDSGSPYGTVINGNFVFLGNAWTGPGSNDDGGSFLASNIPGLVSAMDALVSGSSSTLTYADLSGFNTY